MAALSLGDVLASTAQLQPKQAPKTVRSARSQNRASAWSYDLAKWREYRLAMARSSLEREGIEREYSKRLGDGPDFTHHHGGDFVEPHLHCIDAKGKAEILAAYDAVRRWQWRNARKPHGQAVSRAYREVLSALLSLAVRHGRVFPSYEKLAQMACCSRSTVYRALQWLKAWGLLDWKRRLKRIATALGNRVQQTSNAYQIAVKGLAAVGAAILQGGPECHKTTPSSYTPLLTKLLGQQRQNGAASRHSR